MATGDRTRSVGTWPALSRHCSRYCRGGGGGPCASGGLPEATWLRWARGPEARAQLPGVRELRCPSAARHGCQGRLEPRADSSLSHPLPPPRHHFGLKKVGGGAFDLSLILARHKAQATTEFYRKQVPKLKRQPLCGKHGHGLRLRKGHAGIFKPRLSNQGRSSVVFC